VFFFYYNVLNTRAFQALNLAGRLMLYILDFKIYDTSLAYDTLLISLLYLYMLTSCVKRLNESKAHC
jgi:hypothetical protein